MGTASGLGTKLPDTTMPVLSLPQKQKVIMYKIEEKYIHGPNK